MRRLIVYGVYCAFNWNKYTICQNFRNTFAFHHQWLGNEKREKKLEKKVERGGGREKRQEN